MRLLYTKMKYRLVIIFVAACTLVFSVAFGVAPFLASEVAEQWSAAGAIATVAPSFAGVLLATWAIVKQIELDDPEIKISKRLELQSKMAQAQLTLLSLRCVQPECVKPSDVREGALLDSQMAELEEPQRPYFAFQRKEIENRVISENGDDYPSLVQMVSFLEPVISSISWTAASISLNKAASSSNAERLVDTAIKQIIEWDHPLHGHRMLTYERCCQWLESLHKDWIGLHFCLLAFCAEDTCHEPISTNHDPTNNFVRCASGLQLLIRAGLLKSSNIKVLLFSRDHASNTLGDLIFSGLKPKTSDSPFSALARQNGDTNRAPRQGAVSASESMRT